MKELKKGDCHKKRGGSGKTIQEQMLEITGKNGNHSDGSLISFTAEQIRGPQQQVLYSSSTHKKGEREKNFLSN